MAKRLIEIFFIVATELAKSFILLQLNYLDLLHCCYGISEIFCIVATELVKCFILSLAKNSYWVHWHTMRRIIPFVHYEFSKILLLCFAHCTDEDQKFETIRCTTLGGQMRGQAPPTFFRSVIPWNLRKIWGALYRALFLVYRSIWSQISAFFLVFIRKWTFFNYEG